MLSFTNPADDEIKKLLESIRTIAVVGLSPKAGRPSHTVAKAMQARDYHIIPVRPATEAVLGEKAWPDLYSVKADIDLVNVFLNPSRVDAVIDACIDLKLPAVWLQEGVINEQAAQRAVAAGITVIMDRCIYKEHDRLLKP